MGTTRGGAWPPFTPVRGAVNVAGPGTIGLTRMMRRSGGPAAPCRRLSSNLHRRARAALGGAPCPTTCGGYCATGAGSTPPTDRGGRLHTDATRRPRAVRGLGAGAGRPAAEPSFGRRAASGTVSDRGRSPAARRGDARPAPGPRSPPRLPARPCAPAWRAEATRSRPSQPRAWRCRARGAAPSRGRCCSAGRETTPRTSGASTRSSPSPSSRSSSSYTSSWWRVEAGRRQRARPRPRPAGRQPRRHPAMGRASVHAVLREHPLPRDPRVLVLDSAFDLPWLSSWFASRRRRGLALNAVRLLEQASSSPSSPRARGGSASVGRALSPAALRPRRLRRARAAHRRPDDSGRRSRRRGDLPEWARLRPGSRACYGTPCSGDPYLPVARPARLSRCPPSGGSSSASPVDMG